MMKKLKTLITLLSIIGLASCSGDDDGGGRLELNNENVAGQYQVVLYEQVIVEREESQVSPGTFIEVTTEITGRDFNQQSNLPILTFSSDGNLSASGGFITEEFTIDNDGDRTGPIVDNLDLSIVGFQNYSIDQNEYTLTVDIEDAGVQFSTLYSVEKFDQDELDLEYNEVETVNNIEYNYTTRYELERIEE